VLHMRISEILSKPADLILQHPRVAAPLTHAFLFILTWVLYSLQSEPLLDGPSKWPFAAVFVGDLPLSFIAFAVMSNSGPLTPYAVVCLGIIGTSWWYFLGRCIEVRKHR